MSLTASSTKFYLQDKRDGKPWITKLPFPVHVVERVETIDHISRNRFVTSYKYHHGYFDGHEREFRGFGMVEQKDTEEFAALTSASTLPEATNLDAASHVTPVLTKTWFHNGIYLGRDHVSDFFAGLLDMHDQGEYYREPAWRGNDVEARKRLLADTNLPADFTLEEAREACRALKGAMLRQEVYALDGTPKAEHPYTVTEQNFNVERLQPHDGNRHAVFFTHAHEAISYHYERNPDDPRIQRALTLEVDPFGNVLKSAAIGYGRRSDDPDPVLTDKDRTEQQRVHVTYTENEYTKAIQQDDDYRTPLIAESRTYEILNISQPGAANNLFLFDEIVTKLQAASDGKHEIPYEDINAEGALGNQPWRRLIERVRILYRRNDLAGLLSFKDLHSMALPGESFKLAFTPGLLSDIFKRKRIDGVWEELLPDPASILGQGAGEGGGYVDLEGDNHWWMPSGRIFYSPGTDDAELAYARQHFFLPIRYRDPFHNGQFSTETKITYDPYDLLIQETQDALGNCVTTVGDRDKTGALIAAGLDYRVLQPKLITDPNGNRTAAVFDALGMVAGTAVMGKNPELDFELEGDLLDASFAADLTAQQISDFLDKPHDYAGDLLGKATTRIIYDLDCFKTNGQPVFAATLVRETHVSDPSPDETNKIQISFSYSDGFGREIQKKIQAEPGKVEVEDAAGNISTVDTTPDIRWVGSGWTIFNNKGKPVCQYEPFFSIDHQFQFGKKVGVSSVLFYDPVERVIATLHPNKTFEKVVFDPWRQTTWDVNDTVMLDPRTDPDVSTYMANYFASQDENWKTWLQERIADPQNPPADSHGKTPEQDAAVRTLAHANTPAVAFFDSLGRAFLTVADNGPDQNAMPRKYTTRVKLDIENNQREVVDAKDRIVMRYDYDMLGNRIHQDSMEAGERWILNDVAGKSLYSWDSRGQQFRALYDQLRRPTGSCVLEGDGPELLVGRTVYGESCPDPETFNLRGKAYQNFDQAGVVTTDDYDFKGNLLKSNRQLAVEYKATLDWLKNVELEPDVYTSRTSYDALNRPVTLTAPDASVIRPSYNEANLLEKIEANLRGDSKATPFVTNINYNAKGQRTLIEYGIVSETGNSRVRTEYQYDPNTFRLTQILTTRDTNDQLQALNYFYDPAGNITYLHDDAQQTIYFDNQRVEPSGDYVYDAIYRLIEARGQSILGKAVENPMRPRRLMRSMLSIPACRNPATATRWVPISRRMFMTPWAISCPCNTEAATLPTPAGLAPMPLPRPASWNPARKATG